MVAGPERPPRCVRNDVMLREVDPGPAGDDVLRSIGFVITIPLLLERQHGSAV